MEIFFISSYGGLVAVLAILSLFSSAFILPIIVGLYFGLVRAVFFIDCLTNYFFHKIRLFERLGHKKD